LPDGKWQTLPARAEALEILDKLHRLCALGVTTWLDQEHVGEGGVIQRPFLERDELCRSPA
jgi:hypothetical protein